MGSEPWVWIRAVEGNGKGSVGDKDAGDGSDDNVDDEYENTGSGVPRKNVG